MTTNELKPWETLPPVPRYLVLVPIGVMFRREYDGPDEAAAKAAYWEAFRLGKSPVFTEARAMVMV